jgi:hypothetical protein
MWLKNGKAFPKKLITEGPKGAMKGYVFESACVSADIRLIFVAKNKITL